MRAKLNEQVVPGSDFGTRNRFLDINLLGDGLRDSQDPWIAKRL